MAAVFWDTNLFIYLIEEQPRALFELVVEARRSMLEAGDFLVTSALTVGEVLVHPLREGHPEMADRYAETIARTARVVPLDVETARRYGSLRADNPKLRPPDAIQLAAAGAVGVSVFVTNDRRLQRISVPGIGKIQTLEQAAG